MKQNHYHVWGQSRIQRLLLKQAACLTLCMATQSLLAEDLRLGIIGLDTSHAIAFTQALNGTNTLASHKGFRISAIYPPGSKDIPSSTNRVAKYLETVKPYNVEIVTSIDKLLLLCDAVLLESNDGRVHLEQALPVFKSGKKVFIDKPIAASLTDCIVLFKLAARYKTPMFSSSSLRYLDKIQEIRAGKHGNVGGADAWSPCTLEPTHPDLMWYGIHGVETLFTAMGTGCDSVVRVNTPGTDVVVGTWKDGRIGVFRGTRAVSAGYGYTVYTTKGMMTSGKFSGYDALLTEILAFFKTGTAPVSPEETIEIFAFMEAADESKRRNGTPVKLADVLAKAQQEAAVKVESLK
jgi:predicted dehydrogenase